MNQSVYSYYTEKTDMNESMLGESGGISPDKFQRERTMINAPMPNVMVDLEKADKPRKTAAPNDPALQAFILDQ